MRLTRILAARAIALPAAALGGCDDDGARREVAELRAKVESRTAEADALVRRVKELEARSRSLEEQVASLSLRPGAPAAAKAPRTGAPAAPGEEAAVATPDASAPAAPGDVAAYFDTEAGKQKLRDFLQAEERARDQRNQQAVREQMETSIRDRVTGALTEQLGLDRRQQDALVAIAVDTMDKMGEVWRGARDARNDPNFMVTARDKTQQIRQDALDRVAQALTAEQNSKFLEIQADRNLLGRGMGPMGPDIGVGGGAGGRFRGPDQGGGAPSPPR